MGNPIQGHPRSIAARRAERWGWQRGHPDVDQSTIPEGPAEDAKVAGRAWAGEYINGRIQRTLADAHPRIVERPSPRAKSSHREPRYVDRYNFRKRLFECLAQLISGIRQIRIRIG